MRTKAPVETNLQRRLSAAMGALVETENSGHPALALGWLRLARVQLQTAESEVQSDLLRLLAHPGEPRPESSEVLFG